MLKKRFFLAMAMAGITFANTLQAGGNKWVSIFSTEAAAPAWSFVDCTGGGAETFSNIGANQSNYTTRTWTGDNGVSWTATDARTDQDLTGDAIAIRTGALENTSAVSGGVGTLTFSYKRVFTGNSTLKVFVNGVQYGGDITVSADTPNTFSHAVNVAGNVTIEIVNSGNRTVIDNLAWDCFDTVVTGPELQLVDALNTNADCDSLTVDFGSRAVNVYQDATFTVKNTGTANLTVTNLGLSNSADFTVISPSVPFTVSPSGTAIVLVRFQSATAGSKTSVLTIESNDTDEASCTVNLEGTALEPCVAPVVEDTGITVSNVTATDAEVEVNAVADNYLAVVTTGTSLSDTPDDTVTYAINDNIGGGVVVYNGPSATFAISGLTEDTDYTVFVFPYNSTDCSGGPLYNTTDTITAAFSTPEAPCIGGSETFSNIGANQSSYTTRTWTGDNGVSWTATDARTDQDLTGDAIAIRTGSLTNNAPVDGGINILSFNYKRVFTGNSTLKVFVNGVQYGGDITVSSETPTLFSETISVDGPVTIEIENSGNRTVIDDISWDCYQTPEGPELQLVDSDDANQPCGFTLSFGVVEVDTLNDAVFVIENTGNQDLTIDSFTLSDAVNYQIVSPAVPFTLTASNSEEVVVRFTSLTEGNYPATLTIESNDVNEGECIVNLDATALFFCEAPLMEGGILDTNITDSSVDIEVTDTTADGYLAIVSVAGSGTVDTPVYGVSYQVNDTLGAGTVAYVGTSTSFTIAGLNPETTYDIYVYGYNEADCIGGPVYGSPAYQAEIVTTAVVCTGGSETFTNIGANQSNYTTRTWTGDNGVAWQATDARTDQDLTGDAITLRAGTLENTSVVSGGIGTLTFQYKRVFSGNSTLKVYVNGVQYGSDVTVSSETPATFSEVINVTGNVVIEIENSGQRTVIDNLSWDCYSGYSAKFGAASAKTGKTGTLSVNNEVKLFPNPNKGEFQLDLGNTAQTADVAVYNMAGSLVASRKAAAKEVISLGGVAKGVYMVVITSGNTVTNKKVIVE